MRIAAGGRPPLGIRRHNTHTSPLKHEPMVTFPIALVAKNRAAPSTSVAGNGQSQPKIAATSRRPSAEPVFPFTANRDLAPLFLAFHPGVLRRS